jgi:hypothetical protein
LIAIVATVAFIYFGMMNQTAYVDAGIAAVLAVFVYLGHRWAMIAAMVWWTIEKGYLLYDRVSANPGSAASAVVGQVIWWAIFMHFFYLAFRVEREKRKRAKAAAT